MIYHTLCRFRYLINSWEHFSAIICNFYFIWNLRIYFYAITLYSIFLNITRILKLDNGQFVSHFPLPLGATSVTLMNVVMQYIQRGHMDSVFGLPSRRVTDSQNTTGTYPYIIWYSLEYTPDIQSKPVTHGTWSKNWFLPTQMTPPKRNAWPIVIFCNFYVVWSSYCVSWLS